MSGKYLSMIGRGTLRLLSLLLWLRGKSDWSGKDKAMGQDGGQRLTVYRECKQSPTRGCEEDWTRVRGVQRGKENK